ncbi:NOP16 [Symbiodinium sp. KB8]|nr:NOP16 [Symbiodinium sp. KB8]
MARGSKNLKRRSGRRKVTRRLVSKPYKGGFRDPTMRESFDTKLTTAQNYAKIGLEGNPNGLAQLKGSKSKQAIDSAQFVDIATIQEKLHQPGKKSVNHMREEEIEYLERLRTAHGDNYKKMAVDVELNFQQLTAARLERRFQRLARWRAELAEQAAAAAGAGGGSDSDDGDSTDSDA